MCFHFICHTPCIPSHSDKARPSHFHHIPITNTWRLPCLPSLSHTGPPPLFPPEQFTSPPHQVPLPPTPTKEQVQRPSNETPGNTPNAIPLREKIIPSNKLAMTPDEVNMAIDEAIDKEEAIPTQLPIKDEIGKTMIPSGFALSHPAAEMIGKWGRQGCPVNCGPDWSHDHIVAALQRGPHKSATSNEAIQALQAETEEKIKAGYARVVLWKDLKHNIPAKLKISPVAMVPHKSRKFRTILDLSFKLRHKGQLFPSVNSNTIKLAPQEAMVQLGNCMKRLVSTMADNIDKARPFAFAKVDIKDGFWRLMVSNDDAWNFCYALPQQGNKKDIDNISIVVPNSLQMGWCESPPLFCAVTETARDVIESLLTLNSLPAHKFEFQMMDKAKNLARLQAAAHTINLLEVFVDDFIAATNDTSVSNLSHFSKLTIIDHASL